MSGPLVALTGATGFVGRAALDALDKAGMQVRALARSVPGDRPMAQWEQGDLSDPRALARLVEGAEAVIHVAGLTTAPDAAAFDAANVTGFFI